MKIRNVVVYLLLSVAALGLSGCATRPPTVAHVHLGHALTGVHVTPDRQGYLLVAEERAAAIVELAHAAAASDSLSVIKSNVDAVVKATLSEESFGLRPSLVQASNHITFAASSDDASANVRESAPRFAKQIVGVVERSDLIGLLGADVAASTRKDEAKTLAAEIDKLARQNLEGVDANRDGVIGGNANQEYGMKQLRRELEQMLARENPPYRTVEQKYLFNLVRLPNGRWVFDKFQRGGNIDGYK
jgi:hypothetical protein